jgi:hypothetical protein
MIGAARAGSAVKAIEKVAAAKPVRRTGILLTTCERFT